jgi:hypothetical protein
LLNKLEFTNTDKWLIEDKCRFVPRRINPKKKERKKEKRKKEEERNNQMFNEHPAG